METNSDILNSDPALTVTTTRLINYSRDLVFKAFADPDHLKNWWGPKGFTNTFHAFDLQPGGKWIFTMHGPDGGNYENESVFIKVTEPELVALDHISNPKFSAVFIFTAATAETTNIEWNMSFNSTEEYNKLKAFITEKNEENLDRLETELEKIKI